MNERKKREKSNRVKHIENIELHRSVLITPDANGLSVQSK